MALNQTKGNMYELVSHTWNPMRAKCFHNCSYCHMKGFGRKQSDLKIADSEFCVNLKERTLVFVGSGSDMFAEDIPKDWIIRVFYCRDKFNNKCLFQSKNPKRILGFRHHPVFEKSPLCTTTEINIFYNKNMCNAPIPESYISKCNYNSINKQLKLQKNETVN